VFSEWGELHYAYLNRVMNLEIPKFCDSPHSEITYQFFNLPSWITFSGNYLIGSPLQGDKRNNFITLKVSKVPDQTLSTNFSFTIFVDYPPVFKVYLTDREIRTEFLYQEYVNTSNCEDPDGGPVHLVLSSHPDWLSFDGQLLQGKPS